MPLRDEVSHKGTFGRVLNLSGSAYMPGAAMLSSLAALKIGCGYVFLCSCERAIDAVAAQTQNVVFCPYSELELQCSLADVFLAGCGLSVSDEAIRFLRLALSNIKNIPVVLDADALNILAKCESFIDVLPEKLILTPHPKEAARLLNVSIEEILANPITYAKNISKKYNCVTVLKLHETIVCSKDLEIYVNTTGNSALAKAGSGDVLAGMIAGLLAQRCTPFYAAKLGVYLHGLTGDLAKNDLTKYGVMAHDLIRYIPDSIKYIID